VALFEHSRAWNCSNVSGDGPPIVLQQPECGVDMPHTTTSSTFDPAAIERDGIFQIEGGLFLSGLVGQYIAVHIECVKEAKKCEMVEVRLLRIKPYPEIGPITLTDPMNIIE